MLVVYMNESVCHCAAVQSIRLVPVSCLWLDITEALHRDVHTQRERDTHAHVHTQSPKHNVRFEAEAKTSEVLWLVAG